MKKGKKTNTASVLNVGISHPNAIITEGISDVLKRNNFKVISRAADINSVYDNCSHSTMDVILVSTESKGFSLDAVSYMAAKTTIIIMVSKNIPEISVEEALKAGAGGIISIDEALDNFIEGIQVAAAGNFSVSKGLVETLAKGVPVKTPVKSQAPLTSRETEVLDLIGKGLTNREIGEVLFISTYTVKSHMRNITTKLNLKNRHQASVYANQQKPQQRPQQRSNRLPVKILSGSS